MTTDGPPEFSLERREIRVHEAVERTLLAIHGAIWGHRDELTQAEARLAWIRVARKMIESVEDERISDLLKAWIGEVDAKKGDR